MTFNFFLKKNVHAIFFSLIFFTTLFSCNTKKKLVEVDPSFSQYIEAYTSGIVSKTTAIRIKLSADASTTHAIGEASDKNLFNFSCSG